MTDHLQWARLSISQHWSILVMFRDCIAQLGIAQAQTPTVYRLMAVGLGLGSRTVTRSLSSYLERPIGATCSTMRQSRG